MNTIAHIFPFLQNQQIRHKAQENTNKSKYVHRNSYKFSVKEQHREKACTPLQRIQ